MACQTYVPLQADVGYFAFFDALFYQLTHEKTHERMIKHLQQCTRDISILAYDPDTWFRRGRALFLLGYPELCVGDIYKAQLLLKAAREHTETLLGQQAIVSFAWRWWAETRKSDSPGLVLYPNGSYEGLIRKSLDKLYLQICDVMVRGLNSAACDWACLEACQKAVKEFPSNPTFLDHLQELQEIVVSKSHVPKPTNLGADHFSEGLRNGQVLMRAYPWMTSDLLHRGEKTLRIIREAFEAFPECIIAPSSIRDTRTPEADVLGVFAARDIQRNETILTDRTLSGATTLKNKCSACCGSLPSQGSVILHCCNMQHCSQKCARDAVATFHSAICGRNFSAVAESARSTGNRYLSNAVRSLHLLRILAIVVKEGRHPLESSLISRLTAQYEGDSRQSFDYKTDIVGTNNILQTLGIDIFADVRYDTWVLRTLVGRIYNNVSGGPLKEGYRSSLNLLYSMFNHSHETNVKYHMIGDSTTMRLLANRKILKGEELFICYKDEGSLRFWLGRECECSKCGREKKK